MNIQIEIVIDDSLGQYDVDEIAYRVSDFPSSVSQPVCVGDQMKSKQGHIVDVLHVYHREKEESMKDRPTYKSVPYLEVHVGHRDI